MRSLAMVTALALAPVASAQTYPDRQITIVVPAAPGGVTDLLGRALAKRFILAWGHDAIVENKPGANNQIAAELVTKAAPDGYTLLIGPEATFVVNPFLYAKLPYEPIKGFSPISGLVSIHHALIVNPALPVKNVADLLALGKQKPGALNYGTFGVGSTGHLNMEVFERDAGIRLVPVHYKGATPALTDVMAGHIQLMFISVGSAVPQAKAGKVRMIAIGAPERLAGLPDVPTVAESGVPGFEAVSWFGLYGPAGMPPAVVEKINGEVRKLFADTEFEKTFMAPQFFESIAGSPAELSAHLESDSAKWEKVIRDANIKMQ
ncbi:MAG TPA: tripartite tricarboxylate transporter substrate binding protein [Xanthobacteraceae bacterium]|nr:tripartite tricarboxylate transporter substrate binding protein [Xanthobacteraceae bacterium]